MALKEIFHIKSEQEAPAQATLLIRCGEHHLCFAICNNGGQILHELVYNQTGNWDAEALDNWLANYPVLQRAFYEVHITWDHTAAMLIPSRFYRMEEARNVLQQIQGPQPLADIVSEQVAAWQLFCVYAVPVVLREWMQRHFSSAQCQHQFSTGLKNTGALDEETVILADFRNGGLSCLVIHQHNLLLAQSREYESPEDVIWFLLSVCEQFGLSRETLSLRISGFIDKDSSLYKELYGYFGNISFRDAGWQTSGNIYPSHYFTAVNDLCPCVS